MTSDIDPIQAAIEWVNSNYPPSGGEPSDKDQLVELTTQKGEQVSRILVEMQKSLFAIHRMADIPAKERPELEEMKDRLPQELDRPTDVPLPDFVKSLKRILSDNYTTESRRENGYAMSIFMHKMAKDKQPSSGYDSYLNRITATNLDPVWHARHAVREGKYYVKWVNWYIYVDLLTIYHIYRYLLPELQNPHPLFLLQVSKAETSLVEIVAGVTAEIHRAESPATLTPSTKRGRIARGMASKNSARLETTIKIFRDLSESTRKLFQKHPYTAYGKFLSKAKREGDWGGGKPPSYETWKKWINEHCSK